MRKGYPFVNLSTKSYLINAPNLEDGEVLECSLKKEGGAKILENQENNTVGSGTASGTFVFKKLR